MSLIEGSVESMLSAAREAQLKGADLVELRLDCLEGLTNEKIGLLFDMLGTIRVPKVATIMPDSIFGRYAGSDSERAQLLACAASRADYIDINKEMSPALFNDCLRAAVDGGAQPIISWHSRRTLSADEMHEFISSFSAKAIFKIVMPAVRAEDSLAAVSACSSLAGHRRIIFCYGQEGRISRILSPLFGSEWAYASLAEGKEAAPGQVDLETMRRVQEVLMG